jgi:hypothetical protein
MSGKCCVGGRPGACAGVRSRVVMAAPAVAAPLASGVSAKTNRRARVNRLVRACGGPAPGYCFGYAQKGTVTRVRCEASARATTRLKHGHFLLELVPGRYTLVVHEDGGVPWQRTVRAVAHKTTTVNIIIPSQSPACPRPTRQRQRYSRKCSSCVPPFETVLTYQLAALPGQAIALNAQRRVRFGRGARAPPRATLQPAAPGSKGGRRSSSNQTSAVP